MINNTKDKVNKIPYNKAFFFNWPKWKLKVLDELYKEDNLFHVVQPSNKKLAMVGGVTKGAIKTFTRELKDMKILWKIERHDVSTSQGNRSLTNQYIIAPVFHIESVRASLSSLFENLRYFSIKKLANVYLNTHYNINIGKVWDSWTKRKGVVNVVVSFSVENNKQNPQTGNATSPQGDFDHFDEGRSPESSHLHGDFLLSPDLAKHKAWSLLVNNTRTNSKKEILDEFHYGTTTGIEFIF